MENRSEGTADREAAILRELQGLQQALAHLNAVEQRLRSELPLLDQQINEASRQAYQAQITNQTDQYTRALNQRSTALAATNTLQEQLGRIATRKQEIAARQQQLQAQLSLLQTSQRQADLHLYHQLAEVPFSSAPVALPPSPRRSTHRRVIWLAGITVLVLVLVSLGLVWRLQPSSSAPLTTQRITLSANNQPFYHTASNLPSNTYCVSHLKTSCLSPEAIQQAFRLNPLYHSGFDGAGQTIVLLGAGHTTTLRADVHQFDQIWGLPDPTLTIDDPDGPPAPYTCPGGIDYLEGESTLDVEWAHAIAPGAKIVLVIGSNDAGASPRITAQKTSPCSTMWTM